MAAGMVYHWKHGWIPLDHAAAMAKSHGNAKLAEKYGFNKPAAKRKTPQHIIDYHAARQAQDRRFESLHGAGISAQDTHRQEFKDYFGVGDHSTSNRVEERVTFQTHLRDRAANKADEAAHEHSYNTGVALGQRHHSANLGSAAEDHEFDKAASRVEHPDDFSQGYGDGLTAAYEKQSAGRDHAPINSKRDLAGAILALPETPNKQAAKTRISKRAKELNATDLLPTSMRTAA